MITDQYLWRSPFFVRWSLFIELGLPYCGEITSSLICVHRCHPWIGIVVRRSLIQAPRGKQGHTNPVIYRPTQ